MRLPGANTACESSFPDRSPRPKLRGELCSTGSPASDPSQTDSLHMVLRAIDGEELLLDYREPGISKKTDADTL